MLQDDILDLLAGQGTEGVDLFIGPMPETPVNCVAIRVYPGSPEVRAFDGGSLAAPKVEYPRFQVLVRNTSLNAAWTKARACRDALRWYSGTVNGTVYHNIVLVSDLGDAGMPGDLSHLVAASYEAQKDPS